MNSYTLRINDPAEEWLKKYDKNIQQKFAKKIRKLKENPELHGKPLRKPLHGTWELYFEKKFRIYYTIDKVNHIVYIEGIYHKDEC
ncbi:MAG: type II toxin-antitoxin system RelE/ParE family toxin [Methanoregula sp.]|jgi:mRNA-degrading endonuclease RelE of RelBE toxin-antitoxin system|nr:type II toxin-antitoxin system RelE/ParE family toxin [Methanoregula sp.]